VARSSPQRHGWRRPSWTRALLVETRARTTGGRVPPATLSRALALVHARRGRPRPTLRCPWSPAAKARRLGESRRRLAALPRRRAAVYQDEVDSHRNPTLGLDGLVRGQQKEAVTPGHHVQRYLAGALDVRTGLRSGVEGERKASARFRASRGRLRAD
jgi:hypothetical protein